MGKYVFGLFVLLIGVYFLFENLGYSIGLGSLIKTYWPVIIVFVGAKILFEGLAKFLNSLKRKHWSTGNLLFGLIITAAGVTLLGNNLGWFAIGLNEFWGYTWPLLIIYFGLSILFRKSWHTEFHIGNKTYKTERKKYFIGETVFGERQPWHLDDISLWHGIGETYIDLSTAIIPEREVTVDITGIIGEITVKVPQGLPLKANVDVRIGEVTVFNHNQSGAGRFISYQSEDYEQAEKKINLMISMSIGEVTVKQVY